MWVQGNAFALEGRSEVLYGYGTVYKYNNFNV